MTSAGRPIAHVGSYPGTYQFVGVHGAWTVPAGAVRTAMNLPSTDFIADFDGDTDVDLMDFQTFQACFNGPNQAPRCP